MSLASTIIIIFISVIIFAWLCAFLYYKVIKKATISITTTNTQQYDRSTVFDDIKNYNEQINKFIRLEFLFELKKWLNSSKITQNVSNGEPLFYTQLTDDEFLQKKLSNLTALIVSKMSKDIVNAFYRLYSRSFTYYNKRNDSSNDALVMYVARALELYVERIITDLSILQNSMIKKDSNLKFSDIINAYSIEINNELYILTDTFVMDFRPNPNVSTTQMVTHDE